MCTSVRAGILVTEEDFSAGQFLSTRHKDTSLEDLQSGLQVNPLCRRTKEMMQPLTGFRLHGVESCLLL